MKIKTSEKFNWRLARQVLYISRDKPGAARKFKNDLLDELRRISDSPFSCRKSIFFDNENIWDLVYKGYVVTFRIKREGNILEVFGFHKYEDPFGNR